MDLSERPLQKLRAGKSVVSASDANRWSRATEFVEKFEVGPGLKLVDGTLSLTNPGAVILASSTEDLYSNPNRLFKYHPYALDFDNPVDDESSGDLTAVYPLLEISTVNVYARNFMFFCRESPADAILQQFNFGLHREWVIVQTWCPGDNETVCEEP